MDTDVMFVALFVAITLVSTDGVCYKNKPKVETYGFPLRLDVCMCVIQKCLYGILFHISTDFRYNIKSYKVHQGVAAVSDI